MDSPKGMETHSARSFVPLLFEEARPLKKTARFKWEKFRQRLWDKRAWKEASLAALRDVREVQWIGRCIFVFVIGWILTLIWLLVLFALELPVLGYTSSTACHPDGQFDVYQEGYNLWDASGFFQITLAWGSFSFADAKIIDVVWDVVFGRGGQALLAWISWRVLADYTATSIQVRPITYESFWAIFLQEQPSVYSTYYMIRDFTRSRGLQSRVMMTITIFTAVFVLLFPTLGSAMTGYTPNNDAFVKAYDGTLIPIDSFELIGYVIHDAWRINFTGDYALTFPAEGPSSTQNSAYYARMMGCVEDNPDYGGRYSLDSKSVSDATPNQLCSMHRNVSNYVSDYGFYGLEDKESTWMNQTLPAPVLNVSAFRMADRLDLYGWNWTDPRTNTKPFGDDAEFAFAASNGTYFMPYIKSNGSCQPMSDPESGADSVRETYQWGFSFLQLYVTILLLLLWSIGLAYMWMKARLIMRTRGCYDVPRGFKGVLELAKAIRKELQEQNDPDDLSYDQLAKEIHKRLKGGNIELENVDSSATHSIWQDFLAWCKDEKWWAGAIVVMLGPCIGLALQANSFGWWLMVPILAVTIALVVGRSNRSRVILTLINFIVGTIVFIGAWYGTEYPGGSYY